jgi:hypothetical protein
VEVLRRSGVAASLHRAVVVSLHQAVEAPLPEARPAVAEPQREPRLA